MAAELAAAGVDVVVVEEGGHHPTTSFTPSYGRGLRTLYRDGGLGVANGSPPILFSEGRCVSLAGRVHLGHALAESSKAGSRRRPGLG